MALFKRFFNFPNILSLFSLLFFAAIFFLVRHFMTSMDEYDNITGPYLMTLDKKFYLDQFNMHFPLPYYVAYAFSSFWVNFSPSRAISIFRLSLLSVYLFSFILIFLSYKNSKSKISFSLWIIFLAILVPQYHGNLYLSDTFSTIFIAAIFWIITPIILKLEKLSQFNLFLLILFATLGFWSQPFLGILLFLPLFFITKKQFKFFVITSLTLNFLPLIYFFINGQLLAFINQTILYNFQTYSRFFPEQVGNNSMLTQNIINFFKNETIILTHFNSSISIFQFIVHLSLILFLINLYKNKSYKYLFGVLLVVLASRMRETKINPDQLFNYPFFPFLAIATSTLLLPKYNLLKTLSLLIVFICILLNFKPIFIQSLNTGYNYEVFWSYRQRIGEDISKLTNIDEKILIYPYDSDLYYLSHRQPFDKFLYWYPWINQVDEYKQERLSMLQSNPPALIYYGNMAHNKDPQYYARLFPNLLTNYINVKKDGVDTKYYLRSDLQSRLTLPFSSK